MNCAVLTDLEIEELAEWLDKANPTFRARVLAVVKLDQRREANTIVLDVDGIPMTKGSWRIMRGKLIPDNEGEPEWAAVLGWAARAKLKNAEPVKARYAVKALFTMPHAQGRQQYRRDLDKLARSALDALEGIVWTNDEQVDSLHLDKRRGDHPGAHIEIERLDA